MKLHPKVYQIHHWSVGVLDGYWGFHGGWAAVFCDLMQFFSNWLTHVYHNASRPYREDTNRNHLCKPPYNSLHWWYMKFLQESLNCLQTYNNTFQQVIRSRCLLFINRKQNIAAEFFRSVHPVNNPTSPMSTCWHRCQHKPMLLPTSAWCKFVESPLQMNEWMHPNSILGRSKSELIKRWILSQAKDRSLDLLTCSPLRYHCAMGARFKSTVRHADVGSRSWRGTTNT